MNKAEFRVLLRASFVIAVLIFFTAVLSDFSVRMYYSGTDSFVQIFGALLGILIMTLVIMSIFLLMPDIRKAVLRMFGLEE